MVAKKRKEVGIFEHQPTNQSGVVGMSADQARGEAGRPFLTENAGNDGMEELSMIKFRNDGMGMVILGYEQVYSIGRGQSTFGISPSIITIVIIPIGALALIVPFCVCVIIGKVEPGLQRQHRLILMYRNTGRRPRRSLLGLAGRK